LPENITDERLLDRAGRGDETAFLLLYERHRNRVFRFAYRMLGSVELAEDITHDCFLSLIRQPRRFDPNRSSLGTYLYAAARNLALKHFRHPHNETTIEDAQEELLVCVEEPLQKLLDEELSTHVRRAVASLPPLQREALVLFEYEELSLAEIAAIVETDVGVVKSRLHRARERMRRLLAPYFKSDSRLIAAGKC
jgi:RNA polymerase sigma-70 factor (ECF subfamily)